MFAAIDPFFLIFMLFALGSAVAEWLKKRRQRDELEEWTQEADSLQQPGETTTARPESTPEVSDKKVSWDEELRRLLEGDVSAQTKPDPPPPVVIAPAPQAPKPSEATTARQTTVKPARKPPVPAKTSASSQLPQLDSSQRSAQKKMEKLLEGKGKRRQRSKPRLVNWLHKPESVRQAFVASLIFSPPRAESESDSNSPFQ